MRLPVKISRSEIWLLLLIPFLALAVVIYSVSTAPSTPHAGLALTPSPTPVFGEASSPSPAKTNTSLPTLPTFAAPTATYTSFQTPTPVPTDTVRPTGAPKSPAVLHVTPSASPTPLFVTRIPPEPTPTYVIAVPDPPLIPPTPTPLPAVPTDTNTPNPPTPTPLPMAPGVWFGVNMVGGDSYIKERQSVPGIYGEDYNYPGTNYCRNVHECYNFLNELDYYASKGLKLIRYLVKWERMQPQLYGPLSEFDTTMVDQLLANAQERGMKVIIDSHDAGRRSIASPPVLGTDLDIIGSANVPFSAFTDYWQKMAARFKGRPALFAYALTSEPHDMDGKWVKAGAQAGIDGVRRSDVAAAIVVPGDGWSGGSNWLQNGNDALKNLVDPSGKLVFEAHQYFDYGEGGSYEKSYDYRPAYPTIGVDYIQPFVQWLRDNHLKGLVGEYGVPDSDPRWYAVLDNFLNYLQGSSDVLAGATAWWAGPWPGDSLWIEPQDGQDRPQMSILQKYKSP